MEMNSSGGSSGRGRALKFVVPIVIAIGIAVFKYASAPTVIDSETGRKIRGSLTDQQGEALGLQSFQQVLRSERVVPSGPAADQVVRVAKRLIEVVRQVEPGFDWKVSVVDSPQVNAFCLPGGKIVVYTGLLPVAKNDEGLAVVMGHEIAHAVLRHSSQRMLKTEVLNTVMQGASTAVALGDMSSEQQRVVMGALGLGTKFGVLMPFSRDHETDADERGLLYAARAGYNPQEAVAFWERMSAAGSGGQPPEFLSTHPSHGSRIAHLKEIMPKALSEYDRATGKQR